jgi:glycosyltransferase involved in cell wall biosynthesis
MPLTAFWAAAVAVACTYVVVPLAVLARGRLRPRPHVEGDVAPSISVLVAAHDEAASIASRIDDLLACHYDPDRLEVVVASDGSTDATAAIVAAHPDPRVRLVDLPRVGKARAINAAAAAAGGEVLVLTDANSAFAPDALDALVRPFADPEVGGVAGDQRYVDALDADALAEGERRYWDLDRRLKVAESRAGNVISATGAIYAVRTELFRPVPDGVTDDFWVSTGVVAAGRRLVFCPDAVAYEPVAARGADEFARKVRVMTRGLRGVVGRRSLLDPRRHGFYALQLLWHKALRRLMGVPLAVLAAAAPALWGRSRIYRVAAVGQGVFYGLGLVGLVARRHPLGRHRILALPGYFCLVNTASVVAAANVARGRTVTRWEPRRHRAAVDGAGAGPSTSVSRDVAVGA